MTRGIDDALNLPHMDDIIKTSTPQVEYVEPEEDEDEFATDYGDFNDQSMVTALDAASRNLELMSGDGHAEAMDEIHEKTLKHADDLMDLGYNVDQRSQATIFEKANMLYKTALDAKSSKMDAQLKIRKLLLDQRKLELEERKLQHEMGNNPQDDTVDAEAMVVMDRNALVAKWREDMKREKGDLT